MRRIGGSVKSKIKNIYHRDTETLRKNLGVNLEAIAGICLSLCLCVSVVKGS